MNLLAQTIENDFKRNNSMKIPLVDLSAQYETIKDEINGVMQSVLEEGMYASSTLIEQFEEDFSNFCLSPNGGEKEISNLFCATCGSGTDAIFLALRAIGIGPGNEVITPSHAFISSAQAVAMAGARPVFVDIREDTLLLDPQKIENAITPRTRAIIPVHLYGQSCDMDRILEIASKHGLKVIEDATQAPGTQWKGRGAGTLSEAACFSFSPGSVLSAFGDGGAVVSRDHDLISYTRMLANHGRKNKYVHEFKGIYSKLDPIHAATLSLGIKYLKSWIKKRAEIAQVYEDRLEKLPVYLPITNPSARNVWNHFVIRLKNRDEIKEKLSQKGITTGVHYPIPLHRQPCFQHMTQQSVFMPVTDKIVNEVLSLPIYPELTIEQIDYIYENLEDALDA